MVVLTQVLLHEGSGDALRLALVNPDSNASYVEWLAESAQELAPAALIPSTTSSPLIISLMYIPSSRRMTLQ